MKAFLRNPKTFIESLFRLERSGRYDDALDELREIWDDTATFPNVEDFESKVAAELLMRCGSIIGFIGHNRQIPHSQENSKNLLTEAHSRFLEFDDPESVAECENYLALAYWRTGEYVEAETWLEHSSSHDLSETHLVRLHSHLIQSFVMLSLKRFGEIVNSLNELESKFLEFGDDFLRGSFYTNFGIALRNLGRPTEALEKYRLARHFHQKSGHQIYLGTVENNLAYLHKSENDFTKAHESIDNATEIFRAIKDKTREGFSLDTKAQIYSEEGNYDAALKTIDAALKVLKKGENAGYLVETYLTKSKILLALDDFCSSTYCLCEAVEIAKSRISEEAAKNLIKDFEKEIRKNHIVAASNIFTEKELISGDLELSLPPSISHFKHFQAVRIKNAHLEKIGLKKNSLAIVVDETVNPGDLAAVLETCDGSIYCGFFDLAFGIVCLEGIDSEPVLIDESEIKILGKIVGVSDGGQDKKGKLIVKAL